MSKTILCLSVSLGLLLPHTGWASEPAPAPADSEPLQVERVASEPVQTPPPAAEPQAPPPASAPAPAPGPAQDTWTQPAPPPPAVTQPAPAATPTVPPRRSKRGLGMTIGGFAAFGGIWLLTAIAGAAVFDSADLDFPSDTDVQRQRAFGTRLMIPVGGPFAAAFVAPSATGALFSTLSGVAQVAGLGVGVAGAVIYGRNRQAQRQVGFHLSPTRGGSMLRMRLSF